MRISRSKKYCLTLSSALLSFASATALAQTTTKERVTGTKTKSTRTIVKGASSGFSAILGGEYGIMNAKPRSTELNSAKKGTALEIKGLAGFLYKDWLLDSGLGWYSYKLKGTEKLTDDKGTRDVDGELGVSGLFVEFSPSYRITDSFFAGLITQVRFPAQLDYFSEAKTSGAGFGLGVQTGYQIFNPDLNMKFLFKFASNLGLKNWTDYSLMGGIQFGLPIRQPDSLVIRKVTVVSKVKDITEVKRRDFTITVTANVVKLALDNIINFINDKGRPTLTPESQSFLIDLGGSLQAAITSWEILRVEAETPAHINAVRESLVSTGVPPNKVRTGRVLKAVLDGGNISVDFTFTGVRDSAMLSEAIRNAMKAAQVPENCQQGTCE
ncbi:MAG: hypothetical protein FJY29_09445 [Betaproteobacteria bacterium]|nr:hypothetical protein [Betaproteobacteria bacterium]